MLLDRLKSAEARAEYGEKTVQKLNLRSVMMRMTILMIIKMLMMMMTAMMMMMAKKIIKKMMRMIMMISLGLILSSLNW